MVSVNLPLVADEGYVHAVEEEYSKLMLDATNFESQVSAKIEARTREPEYREKILNILNENKGEKGLDMALFVCFKETIKSLVKRELAICPVTIDVYNWLLRRVKNGEK